MKSIISIASFLVFIFVSSISFAQYKYDIGLKASTFDMERFHLEARFHLKNPYSITVTLINGSHNSGSYSQTPFYNDSLFDITNTSFNASNNVLKLGVQRKLEFLASDVFYVGAAVGFGYERQRSSYYSSTYAVQSDTTPSGSPYFYSDWNQLSTTDVSNRTSSINAQLGVSFGMDVPLTKRFSINAEVAFAAIYEKSFDYPQSFISLIPNVSGGLRYSFGKRD